MSFGGPSGTFVKVFTRTRLANRGRNAKAISGLSAEQQTDVAAGVGESRVQVGEKVVAVSQLVDGADGEERPQVLRPGALQQDGDPAPFELRHDLPEGLSAGGIEDLHVRQAEDQ